MRESSETDLLQAVLEDLIQKSIEQETNGLILRGGSRRIGNPHCYDGIDGFLGNLEPVSQNMVTREQISIRDIPATPSHMRVNIEDQSITRRTNQISSTVNNQSNSIIQDTSSTSQTNQEGPSVDVAPGYYPALPSMLSAEPVIRTIPTNPTPMFTIGNYGNGLFDLMSPVGLAASHDGRTVLVSDQEKNRILIYDMDSSKIQGVIKCDMDIKDLAISTMGHVVVASSKTGFPLAQAYTMEGDKILALGRKLKLNFTAEKMSISKTDLSSH